MTNTQPGAKVTIVTFEVIEEHGYFDDKIPLGGILLGRTVHECKGVLRDDIGDDEVVYVMRLDKNGDFSGWSVPIKRSQIIASVDATINENHELVPYGWDRV